MNLKELSLFLEDIKTRSSNLVLSPEIEKQFSIK